MIEQRDKNIGGLFFYFRDLSLLKKQKGDDVSFVFGKKYPILSERFVDGGIISGHYFHQDLRAIHESLKILNYSEYHAST